MEKSLSAQNPVQPHSTDLDLMSIGLKGGSSKRDNIDLHAAYTAGSICSLVLNTAKAKTKKLILYITGCITF